jgi:hypothetical protein
MARLAKQQNVMDYEENIYSNPLSFNLDTFINII